MFYYGIDLASPPVLEMHRTAKIAVNKEQGVLHLSLSVSVVPALLLAIAMGELGTLLWAEGFDVGGYANEYISAARGIGWAVKDEHKGLANGLQ